MDLERLFRLMFTADGAGGAGGAAAGGGDGDAGDGGEGNAADGAGESIAGGDGGDGGGDGSDPGSIAGGDGAGDGDGGEPGGSRGAGAPESYELSIPKDVTVDDGLVQSFEEVARKFNLSNAEAQQFVDVQIAGARAQQTAWKEEQASWVKEVKADPEFGGDRFDESVTRVRELIGRFGGGDENTKELRGFLADTGLGNYPPLLRFLKNVATYVGEDRAAGMGRERPGGGQSSEDKLLREMYPSMYKDGAT